MDMAVQSANEDVKVMLQDAIMGVQAASASGQDALSKIVEMATHPELKEVLQHGSHVANTWRERLAQARVVEGR